MAVVVLEFSETPPTTWPEPPAGLSAAAAAIPPGALWPRLELWARTRWAARAVEWVIAGPGPWRPPLPGATITATEIWSGTAWATATGADAPLAGPLGALYPAAGPYRVRATLGAGAAPPAALEAYRRLAEYLAAQDPGPATRYSIEVGALTEAHLRPADWAAKAIFQSGAADLLRPYRRLVA